MGLYYLQSRYYNPTIGRFLNADALISTGQGVLGNNMFAYCRNNPIVLEDATGTADRACIYAEGRIDDEPWRDHSPGGGGNLHRPTQYEYIKNQHAPGIGELKLGWATVSHGGCGVVATYNALITLGAGESFKSVLSYFNRSPGRLLAKGFLGTLPGMVAEYFRNKGYTVIVTDDLDGIDAYSQTADACIMWYAWPETYAGFFDAFGAHFVHYRKTSYGYVAYNTGPGGVQPFSCPSGLGYKGDRFYAIGIFIYK